MPVPLLLVACEAPPVGRDGWPPLEGPPTDTVPAFAGRLPRDLVFLSIDTLRKDAVGRWSDGASDTPFLDAWMQDAFVLEDHRTCSDWTLAGVACTLAGQQDWEAGQVARLSGEYRAPFVGGTLLAEHLSEAGFTAHLASANGWLDPEWGLARGAASFAGHAFAPGWPLYVGARDRIEAAIRDGRADRFFLHLHLIEPHAPYDPPADELPADLPLVPWDLTVKSEHYAADAAWPELSPEEQAELELVLRERYAGEVRALDDLVFGIFADLTGRGLLDDALVVVWTDHGEQFWEHGFQSHAYTLHAEENDGIAFFWAPNLAPGTWDGPTLATDLAPTLLALYGLPPDPAATGVVLGLAPEDRARLAFTVARNGALQSVARREWKLTWSWEGAAQLYDRAADPGETDDRFAADHPMVDELWPLLVEQASRTIPLVPEQEALPPPGLSLTAGP